MEDVLGGYSADDRFATFLTDWEVILARRVAEAGAAVGQVNGLSGLILAGGLGRGAPWRLSDIDLIPIFADDHLEAAAADVEALRRSFLERWVVVGDPGHGHCTGASGGIGARHRGHGPATGVAAPPTYEAASTLLCHPEGG